jgi:hypothetical protein
MCVSDRVKKKTVEPVLDSLNEAKEREREK